MLATEDLQLPEEVLHHESFPKLVAGGEQVGSRSTGMKPGDNVSVGDDGDQLVAAVDGELLKGSDGQVSVIPICPICVVQGNVNHATGNVKAEGSVIVLGDVQQGCSVRAGLNVFIEGAVEAAEILARLIAEGYLSSPRATHGNR